MTRVEVYRDGVLVFTYPAPSVERAHLSADYARWQGYHAIVVYGRA